MLLLFGSVGANDERAVLMSLGDYFCCRCSCALCLRVGACADVVAFVVAIAGWGCRWLLLSSAASCIALMSPSVFDVVVGVSGYIG